MSDEAMRELHMASIHDELCENCSYSYGEHYSNNCPNQETDFKTQACKCEAPRTGTYDRCPNCLNPYEATDDKH